MPADWFCVIDGKREGPLTSAQLKELALTGFLLPNHPVWKQGMQGKVPARSVKGLFDRAPVAVPEHEEELIEFEMVAPEPADKLIELEMVAEAVEEREEKPKPPKKPREKKPEEEAVVIVAEAEVTYREGLPDIKGPADAELSV